MVKHTLFAYVDGFDLEGVAAQIEDLCDAFVSETSWLGPRPWVVNQRPIDETSPDPGAPEPWDLGINLDLPDPGFEWPGWFADVEKIAVFLGRVRAQTGRDFVIGIADNEHGFSEDLFTVSTERPDLDELRTIIGVGGG